MSVQTKLVNQFAGLKIERYPGIWHDPLVIIYDSVIRPHWHLSGILPTKIMNHDLVLLVHSNGPTPETMHVKFINNLKFLLLIF